MNEQSVESIFGRAWDLLMKNPAILLPGLIVGLIFGVLSGLLALPPLDTSDPAAISHVDLAARGLISPPTNGTVVIATAGSDAVAAVTAQIEKTEASALERLTAHEAALLRRLLTRVVRTLDG